MATKTLSDKERIETLGALGEEIVGKVLEEAGFNIKQSDDKYDSEKDFLIEGLKVEVKTVVPWFKENALTIDAKQYPKCFNADYVIFVCVPSKGLSAYSNDKYDGNIYVVKPKEVKWTPKTTRGGLPKCLVRINQPGVLLCHKIEDRKILNKLKNLTTSIS
jgi:hypothetical protein